MTTFVRSAPTIRDKAKSGLNIHQKPNRSNKQIVVFVHGWGGHAYKTWGKILTFTYEAVDCDVGTFDYSSGKRRIPLLSPDLDSVSETLLSQLDSLQYEKVLLIAHSMGGVIASTAIRLSHERHRLRGKPPLAERANGIVMLGSPRAGVSWLPKAFGQDGRYLTAHNSTLNANDRFFSDQVNIRLTDGANCRYDIPMWIGRGNGDLVVDSFSASMGVPSDQVGTFPGGHIRFLRNEGLTIWLKQIFANAVSQTSGRSTSARVSALRTQFRGNQRWAEWEDCFRRAIDRFKDNRRNVAIVDYTHTNYPAPTTDLLVRVLPSTDVGTSSLSEEMAEYADHLNDGRIFALGVSTYGQDSTSIDRLPVVNHNRVWLRSSSTPEQLELEIEKWLNRAYEALESISHNTRLFDVPGTNPQEVADCG